MSPVVFSSCSSCLELTRLSGFTQSPRVHSTHAFPRRQFSVSHEIAPDSRSFLQNPSQFLFSSFLICYNLFIFSFYRNLFSHLIYFVVFVQLISIRVIFISSTRELTCVIIINLYIHTNVYSSYICIIIYI